MRNGILMAVVAVGLAGCGAAAPERVEEGLAAAACSAKTYPDFQPSTGCSCKPVWTYMGETFCDASCGNPGADANGPWCFTQGTCNGMNWSYCTRKVTPTPSPTPAPAPTPWCSPDRTYIDHRPPEGCTCAMTWAYAGVVICGSHCGNPDNDPVAPWCFTTATCGGRNWAYCSVPP